MSNPLAIPTVTAALQQYLLAVLADPGLQGAGVSTLPLDRARPGGASERQINLFLYEVTPNAGWANLDLPSRDADGTLVTQPVLALDLHYLLTAYGINDDELDAQHLLGYAMSLLHDQSVLTRDQIRAAITANADSTNIDIAGSDLADQVELIKICPHALTPDDLYKLWTAFQVNYRLSTCYDVSVVLIERPQPTRQALPVRAPNLAVLPFSRPVIDAVAPQVVTPTGTLTIQGRNLKADVVQVYIGANVVTVTPQSDTRITVNLGTAQATQGPGGPPGPLLGSLRPGVNTAQVVQPVSLGRPPAAHHGFESNVVPFALAPQITNPPPITVAAGGTLSLTVTPAVDRAQRVTLLLDDQAITIPARPAATQAATTLLFPVPAGFATGTYLARLRIDGVESLLTADPATGAYNAPAVTVQ